MSTTPQRDEDEVHRMVRERYAQIAREGTPMPETGCCGPRPAAVAPRLGYKEAEIAAVPEGANLGVGCGAPLAQATLRAGENVVDLGSGAGFGAFVEGRGVGAWASWMGVVWTPDRPG